MKKLIAGAALVVLGFSMSVSADVSITSKEQMHAANKAANQAERAAKRARRHGARATSSRRALDTGSVTLIDGSGLKYFINTEISFATSSSASAAMSDASYTHAVAASTALGGTTSTTLTGMFDGYNGACLNVGGVVSSKGIGFCGVIPVPFPIFGTIPVPFGVGYKWGGKLDPMFFSCDYTPYEETSKFARWARPSMCAWIRDLSQCS